MIIYLKEGRESQLKLVRVVGRERVLLGGTGPRGAGESHPRPRNGCARTACIGAYEYMYINIVLFVMLYMFRVCVCRCMYGILRGYTCKYVKPLRYSKGTSIS